MKKNVYPLNYSNKSDDVTIQSSVNMMEKFPVQALLQTIEVIILALRRQGHVLRDFDNKKKVVQQVRLIGGKPYFLSSEPENDVDKYESEIQKAQDHNHLLAQQVLLLRKENERLRKFISKEHTVD